MQNWHKYRNYKKVKNADRSYTYFIIADGKDIKVKKTIYEVYAQGGRKMEYMECDLKRDRVLQDASGKVVTDKNGLPIILPEREVSLDKLIGEDWDFVSEGSSPEDILFAPANMELDELYRCISLLSEDEKLLINTLFFQGLTEQEYAETLSVKRQAINQRKLRILKKIKKLWEQPC